MYCLVQIQNLQFDSFVFTCTQPVNSKFTIWNLFKCNDDGGFRSFLIYSYVCLSIQMSVCPFVDLSIRLPVLVSTQTLAKLYVAESKLIQTRVALLIKNFPAREMLAEMTLFSLSWNTIIYVQTSAVGNLLKAGLYY